MHDERPSEIVGEYQPPPAAAERRRGSGWKSAGGAAVGLALVAAKFKALLAFLLTLKWLFLGGKFLLSFGSIFVSIWFYALAFGWKLGVVFVLLILVHEMGHWVVLRGMGVPVSLPYFIPGLGAFVAQKAMTPSGVHDAAAALAGPVVGLAGAGLCYAYGVATHNVFWIVAAHIGFILNLFNLIPVLPFDGGRVAGTIEPRLWMLGIVAFVAFIAWSGLNHPIAWFWLLLIGVISIPRAIDAWRGVVDPRVLRIPGGARGAIAAAYFGTIAIAALAAAVSNVRL